LLRHNAPVKAKKLNGWTDAIMEAFKEAFIKAGKHNSTKAVIFTGAGNYLKRTK